MTGINFAEKKGYQNKRYYLNVNYDLLEEKSLACKHFSGGSERFPDEIL